MNTTCTFHRHNAIAFDVCVYYCMNHRKVIPSVDTTEKIFSLVSLHKRMGKWGWKIAFHKGSGLSRIMCRMFVLY